MIIILIGIIDSGLGAINVLNNLIKQKKYNEYILILDYLYNPYGNKSEEVLYNRLLYLIKILKNKGCKKIIIACNTLSIVAFKYNVLNVITPLSYFKKEISNYNNGLLLATKYTIDSNYYKCGNSMSSDLVNYIEGRNSKNINEYNNIINNYDVLLLGCTHYGLIKNKFINKKIVDSAKVLADNFNLKSDKLIVNIYVTNINNNIINHINYYLHINRYIIKHLDISI